MEVAIKMAVNVIQLSAAISRAEKGARDGRVIRLVAWQVLHEGASSLRATAKMRPMLLARLDALWPSVEAVTARTQAEVA